MKEWKQSLLRVQEDGMEAIEGLLVITLTLFVLFFIWGYGFLLFQQFVVIRAEMKRPTKLRRHMRTQKQTRSRDISAKK